LQQTASSFLALDTDGGTSAASRLRVLTSDSEAPVVAETSVGASLLESLQVLTELRIQTVRGKLVVATVLGIETSVEEPLRDVVLQRLLDDVRHLLDLVLAELTCSLVRIDASDLADQVREAATETLDAAQGVRDTLLTVDVRVQHTVDVNEGFGLLNNEAHYVPVYLFFCNI
jgi:hypothetical protein